MIWTTVQLSEWMYVIGPYNEYNVWTMIPHAWILKKKSWLKWSYFELLFVFFSFAIASSTQLMEKVALSKTKKKKKKHSNESDFFSW